MNIPDVTIGCNLAGVLAQGVQVLVHLLKALPNSLDPSTWMLFDEDGYAPFLTNFSVIDDNRPGTVVVGCNAYFFLPNPSAIPVAFGCIAAGYGVLTGLVGDQHDQPLTSVGGFFPLQIIGVAQQWMPPGT